MFSNFEDTDLIEIFSYRHSYCLHCVHLCAHLHGELFVDLDGFVCVHVVSCLFVLFLTTAQLLQQVSVLLVEQHLVGSLRFRVEFLEQARHCRDHCGEFLGIEVFLHVVDVFQPVCHTRDLPLFLL